MVDTEHYHFELQQLSCSCFAPRFCTLPFHRLTLSALPFHCLTLSARSLCPLAGHQIVPCSGGLAKGDGAKCKDN
jgi:hypothetical protein